MTTTLETSSPYFAGFDEAAFATLPTAEPELLRKLRREAFDEYAAMPAPTLQTEEFRRTNPTRFGFGKVTRPPQLTQIEPAIPGPWDDQFDVVVAISEAGFSITRNGDSGITVLPLAEAAELPAVAELLRGPACPADDRKFRSLADAFWNVGLFVDIPDNLTTERGVLIRYDFTTETCIIPRLLVRAGHNSQARLLEHCQSADATRLLACSSREYYLDTAARLNVVTLQEWGDQAVHIGEDWARVAADATIDLVSLSLGARTSKLMVGCDVAAPNANAYLGGLYFAHDRQHFDQKTLQRHSAPNTYSNMLYKGAAKDRGHSVYQGFIQATKGSIGVDAYQTNNNLLLSEGAQADSIPGLIIDADDLACSHGATMGNLDPEQIYYLRARGLSEATARKMLVMGFFEEVIERVPFAMIRDRLHQSIETKIG